VTVKGFKYKESRAVHVASTG